MDSIENPDRPSCNCMNPTTCPVQNKCLSESVVYTATVHDGPSHTEYIGLTDLTFKTRYNLHTKTFKKEAKKAATTLSSYVWENNLNPNPNITWEIVKKMLPI